MEITKDMVFLVAPAAEPTSAETAWQATWLSSYGSHVASAFTSLPDFPSGQRVFDD